MHQTHFSLAPIFTTLYPKLIATLNYRARKFDSLTRANCIVIQNQPNQNEIPYPVRSGLDRNAAYADCPGFKECIKKGYLANSLHRCYASKEM